MCLKSNPSLPRRHLRWGFISHAIWLCSRLLTDLISVFLKGLLCLRHFAVHWALHSERATGSTLTVFLLEMFLDNGFQRLVSPGKLLEMHIWGPPPDLLTQALPGWGPAFCALMRPASDCGAGANLGNHCSSVTKRLLPAFNSLSEAGRCPSGSFPEVLQFPRKSGIVLHTWVLGGLCSTNPQTLPPTR